MYNETVIVGHTHSILFKHFKVKTQVILKSDTYLLHVAESLLIR